MTAPMSYTCTCMYSHAQHKPTITTATTVRNAIYSRVQPEPVTNPQLVAVSAQAMAACLDLSPEELAKREADVAAYFGGACSHVLLCGWGRGRGLVHSCVCVCVCVCLFVCLFCVERPTRVT